MRKILITAFTMITLNIMSVTAYAAVDSDIHDQVCTPEMRSSLGYLAAFDLVFPPAAILYVVSNGLSDICPDETDRQIKKLREEFTERMDELDDRMDDLENNLELTGFRITSVMSALYKVALNQATNVFDAQLSDFDKIYDYYHGVFATFGHEYLKDFVANEADSNGMKSTFQDWFKNGNFSEQFTHTGTNLKTFDDILGNGSLPLLKEALNGRCKDIANISGEVRKTRRDCNSAMLYILTEYNARALNAKKMFHDVINTRLAANLSSVWLNSREGKGLVDFNNGKTPWAQASAEVNKIIDTKSKLVHDTLIGVDGKNVYNELDQFPSELKASMGNVGCTDQVDEWYANPTDGKPYIVTHCYYDFAHSNSVKAKYYLKGGYKVSNVLGSLIPVNAKPVETSKIDIPVEIENKSFVTGDFIVSKHYVYNTTAKFNLKSDKPLRINALVSKDRLFIPSQGSHLSFPTHYENGEAAIGEADIRQRKGFQFSKLLPSSNGEVYATEFSSYVWNTARGPDDWNGSYVLNPVVRLSFEWEDGFAYAFGLRIRNLGGIHGDCDSHQGQLGICFDHGGKEPSEEISLVCPTDTQCFIPHDDPYKIVWNDGTYVKISGSGDNISLTYGKTN
jgi:hypothetical protein